MNIWQKIVLAGMLLIVGQAYAEDTVHYYYTDPQGTVLAKADAAGNVIASYDYAPYGSQALGTPPSGGPTGYTGHVNDSDTGLVYMQARYYDPAVGRFLSTDPVGPASGHVFNFNRYGYANNNPVVNMDPDGRCTGSHISNGDGTCASSGDFTTRASNANNAHSIKSSAIPKNTPNSMIKYFIKSDPQSMAEAAVATMDYFGIDHANVDCCNYVKGDRENAEMGPNGMLGISGPLFSHSFGMIGAILFHEVGVHWDLQFAKGAILDGMYTQAWFMREVQAYDLETNEANIRRFGLTPAEVSEERKKRTNAFRQLSPVNQKLINENIYKP